MWEWCIKSTILFTCTPPVSELPLHLVVFEWFDHLSLLTEKSCVGLGVYGNKTRESALKDHVRVYARVQSLEKPPRGLVLGMWRLCMGKVTSRWVTSGWGKVYDRTWAWRTACLAGCSYVGKPSVFSTKLLLDLCGPRKAYQGGLSVREPQCTLCRNARECEMKGCHYVDNASVWRAVFSPFI